MQGQIISYNEQRGFGFLVSGLNKIFFHARYFAKGFQPVVGRHVKFDLAPGKPGKDVMAANIEYIDLTDEDKKLSELVRLTSLAGQDGVA